MLGIAVVTELYQDVSAAALNAAIDVFYPVIEDDWPEHEMERKRIGPSQGRCIDVCMGMNAKLLLVLLNENF